MSKNTLIFDIDDTILSWRNSFTKWVNDVKGLQPVEGVIYGAYNLEHVFGLPVEVIVDWVSEFNTSPHFSELEFLEGAKETLIKLKEQDYKIVAISSCGDHADTYKYRYNNIGKYLDRMHLIPLRKSKLQYLYYHKQDTLFFLDDHPQHVEDAKEVVGINAFHFGDDVGSINSWYEVHDKIEELKCL